MTKVQLTHNPFLCKTEIRINDELFTNTSSLFRYRNTPMQDWVVTFLPELIENCNDDEIAIIFSGLQFNYDSLETQVQIYKQNNRDVHITLEHEVSRSPVSRIGELTRIINEINSNQDLSTEESIEEISKRSSSILEIVVISSDDKLRIQTINNLIGQPLLKLNSERGSKIIDFDKYNYFESESSDNEDMFDIINGNIPFVNSKHTQLMITDTTNSEKLIDDYYRYIKKAITDPAKPMILFVIDRNLPMNNEEFLSMIADQYNQKGMQNKERFIFIADNSNSAKKYLLSEYAIKNALVYSLDDNLLIQEKIQKYIGEYCMIQKVLNVKAKIEETLEFIKESIEEKAKNNRTYDEIERSAKIIEIELSKLKVECSGVIQSNSIKKEVDSLISKIKQSFKEDINSKRETKLGIGFGAVGLFANAGGASAQDVRENVKSFIEKKIDLAIGDFLKEEIEDQCKGFKCTIDVNGNLVSALERMDLSQIVIEKLQSAVIKEINPTEIKEISIRTISEAKNAISNLEIVRKISTLFAVFGGSTTGKTVENNDGTKTIIYKFYDRMLELTKRELYSDSSYLESSKITSCIKVFDSNIVLIKPIIEKVLSTAVSQIQVKSTISNKMLETIKADTICILNSRLEELKKSTQISISEQEKLNHIDELLVQLSGITEL